MVEVPSGATDLGVKVVAAGWNLANKPKLQLLDPETKFIHAGDPISGTHCVLLPVANVGATTATDAFATMAVPGERARRTLLWHVDGKLESAVKIRPGATEYLVVAQKPGRPMSFTAPGAAIPQPQGRGLTLPEGKHILNIAVGCEESLRGEAADFELTAPGLDGQPALKPIDQR